MGRIEQVNELLHQNLAEIINEEISIENGLITLSYVDCSADLKSARVAVSALPENLAGTALERLRNHSGQIAATLSQKIRIKSIPRFKWIFDPTEKNAAALDKVFNEIEKEDKT